MVGHPSARSAWQRVAAKVVAANRLRRGSAPELRVEDFIIEELGGRMGQLIFGPVAIFNGNVSMQVKKPLKDMKLTVTFSGMTETEQGFVTFISVSQKLYTGDLQEGLRSFLFGFQFPYLNLPPTSSSPLLCYSFSAKLTSAAAAAAASTTASVISADRLEFKSKPLPIVFIPYVDPALETPKVSAPVTPKKMKSIFDKKGKGRRSPTIAPAVPVNGINIPPNGNGVPKLAKPKLTLTTADLPSTASGNSTPVIDRPHPSTLSSAATRTAIMKDNEDNTIARLTVIMPKTRFLPGDEIVMKLRLEVLYGDSMPKGLGVRVVEQRSLAREDLEDVIEEEESDDDDIKQPNMSVIGKEHLKVLAGKKFILHHGDATDIGKTSTPTTPSSRTSTKSKPEKIVTTVEEKVELKSGKVIELAIKVRLPSFQTFISDLLLPTSTLPLGPSPGQSPSSGSLSPESAATSPIFVNLKSAIDPGFRRKRKVKSPLRSTSTPTASSSSASVSTTASAKGLNFIVNHVLQITVPINGNSWFKKSSPPSSSLNPNKGKTDLEVAVPLILGNKNPSALFSKKKTPELRVNGPEEKRVGSMSTTASMGLFGTEGSSRSLSSRRSTMASSSGAGSVSVEEWREGERFLTLKETGVRPGFVSD